jgi:hypothetical protein
MAEQKKAGINLEKFLPRSWLPLGWEEISRYGNENQLVIQIGHINPEDKADPVLTSGNPSQVVDGEAVAVHGISTRGSLTKFYEAMKKTAATGWMKGYTPAKIENMRSEHNKLWNEKYDMISNISVINYGNEKMAEQALQNQIALPTQGFAGLMIPGADGKMTNYLDNEEVKKHLTPEQLKMIKEGSEKAKGEIAQKHKEAGLKYFLGEYLGYPAALSEMDNPEYQRFIAPKPKAPPPDPHAFHGGGFDPLAGKGILPQRPKPGPPPKVIKGCLAIQVDNFVISGTLLSMAEMLPSGDTFSEGLTEHKTYIEKEEVEGHMYTTKHIVPVASTYAKEGYAYKEQVEQMLKNVIDSVVN